MTPFILMMGLGAHAIFEGIAVGISKDMSQV
jgi:zinc transporter ZupT